MTGKTGVCGQEQLRISGRATQNVLGGRGVGRARARRVSVLIGSIAVRSVGLLARAYRDRCSLFIFLSKEIKAL